uniref:Ig-like domain-containing protein n=1 Tax=Podarcis muralis TaxID=64176 RepID=A0A670JYL3_PODMU
KLWTPTPISPDQLKMFLFLNSLKTGVSSQSDPTQPASESVTLGQTVKLSCTSSGRGSNYIHWYQQRSGQAPRFVQYDGSSRGEGIPDRFTASRSGNIGYLTITNFQPGDEAVYYCGRWYGLTSHSNTN